MWCGREAGVLDVLVDGVFEGARRAADLEWGGWFVGVQECAQEPVLQLGVEHGEGDGVVGEL